MRGIGRKNLKREALEHGVEEPQQGHVLMRVVGLRGGNIVEAENAAGESTLCLLPAKFQKTIWIKTGTIVVVDEADRAKALEAGSKVTGSISRVLLEDQVRALRKSAPWWPQYFKDERLVFLDAPPATADGGVARTEESRLGLGLGDEEEADQGSGSASASDDEDGLPPLEANSNRQHAMSTYECAESDSDDSSCEEEKAEVGIKKLRFKPAYNPYTEPSMEIFSYHEGLKKWVEVGNSGMFRPEMLQPMGLPEDVSVIAWGLSLERPTMIMYGIDNIRDLFGHKVDLRLIKSNPIGDQSSPNHSVYPWEHTGCNCEDIGVTTTTIFPPPST